MNEEKKKKIIEYFKKDLQRNCIFYLTWIAGFALLIVSPRPNFDDPAADVMETMRNTMAVLSATILLVFGYATRHATWIGDVERKVDELEEKIGDLKKEGSENE